MLVSLGPTAAVHCGDRGNLSFELNIIISRCLKESAIKCALQEGHTLISGARH